MYKDGFFEGWDATPLYLRSWTGGDAGAAVVIVHGVGEHSGRHTETAEYLAGRGLDVYAYDQRGHGRSGGNRGHVLAFSEYRHDLDRCIEHCAAGKARRFLLGQSFGGLVVLDYGLRGRHAVDGIVACSPSLKLAFRPPWHTRLAGRVMSVIAPSFSLEDRNVSASFLSHENGVVDGYRSDPLVHHLRSARFYTELMRTMKDTAGQASEFRKPCLLLQAGDDRIVSAEAVAAFYQRLGSADRTLNIYDGFYHEILKDAGRERPLSDLARWILERARSG